MLRAACAESCSAVVSANLNTGVHDIAHDEAWVSVGVDLDTAAFAVESIRRAEPDWGDHNQDRPPSQKRA